MQQQHKQKFKFITGPCAQMTDVCVGVLCLDVLCLPCAELFVVMRSDKISSQCWTQTQKSLTKQ